ncbi:MAG: hypothetical protein ABJG41_16950 [Cyclobacteriaceae bacterium]
MNLNKLPILLLIIIFGCTEQEKSDSFIIGQWQTTNKNAPHWVKFDSLNNYYRWSFNEEPPEKPGAKYILQDSVITFIYPPLNIHPPMGNEDITSQLKFKLIDQNSFTILPLDSGLMPTYIYERAQFEGPRYAEIYILCLTDEEADSMQDRVPNYQASEDSLFADAFYLLEHSWINYQFMDSTYVITKDGSTYNKFDLDGYGIIYFTNDSTYLRRGFPERQKFQTEIDSFFHFVNRIPSFNN